MTARIVLYAIGSGHPKVVFTIIFAPDIASISMRTTTCDRILAWDGWKVRDSVGQSVALVATDWSCNN